MYCYEQCLPEVVIASIFRLTACTDQGLSGVYTHDALVSSPGVASSSNEWSPACLCTR